MGKKSNLASVLKKTGILPVLGGACDLFSQHVRIITYHRILDVVSVENYPFDENLVSATKEDFIWQMNFIKQRFKPMTLRALHGCLVSDTKPPPNSVIITFDDGFVDNFEVAYPVLKELEIPATFFVTVGQIGEKESFWFDKVVYMIKKAMPGTYHLNSIDKTIEIHATEKKNNIRDLLRILKQTDNEKRLALVDELEAQFSHAFYEHEKTLSATMSWEQIIELSRNGMEIASHTMTHPVLSKLSRDELEWELSESKRIIEEKTGHSCESISYPVGGLDSFNAETINLVKKYYKMGCTYVKGTNKLSHIDCHQLKRIHISSTINNAMFEATLLCPQLFSR